MSKMNRPPMSIANLKKHMDKKDAGDKIAVVVASVTDDVRLYDVPKMTVCALRFTNTARARITKAGGECLTFDQLALRAPTGENTILLRGSKSHREVAKYFGAPGARRLRCARVLASRSAAAARLASRPLRRQAGGDMDALLSHAVAVRSVVVACRGCARDPPTEPAARWPAREAEPHATPCRRLSRRLLCAPAPFPSQVCRSRTSSRTSGRRAASSRRRVAAVPRVATARRPGPFSTGVCSWFGAKRSEKIDISTEALVSPPAPTA